MICNVMVRLHTGFTGRRVWVIKYAVAVWHGRLAKAWRALRGH